MLKDLTSIILKHTVISRSHLTPEIPLRLITPICPLWTAKEDETPFKDPFWAFYWPGGQATARYILDNGEMMRNRRILDLGCGCGAGSIAAAKMNAKYVLANDIDPYALTATQINARYNFKDNKTKMDVSLRNFIGSECNEFDTVLIGDMFYDEEFANSLFEWLIMLSERGKRVLIGDPGRHGLTAKRRKYVKKLASYKLSQESCLENHGFTETTLWTVDV